MLAYYTDHSPFGSAYINKYDYIGHTENRHYACLCALHYHNHFSRLCWMSPIIILGRCDREYFDLISRRFLWLLVV